MLGEDSCDGGSREAEGCGDRADIVHCKVVGNETFGLVCAELTRALQTWSALIAAF